MKSQSRLEEQRGDWQAYCAPQLEQAVRRVEEEIARLAAQPDQAPVARALQARDAVGRLCRATCGELARLCAGWLQERRLWPENGPSDWAVLEIEAGLEHLPAPPDKLPAPAREMSIGSWAISAVVGSVVGMVALTPLSLLLFGQREVGLGLGAVLGTALAVVVVGWLSRSPWARSYLEKLLALSAAGTLVVGVWTVWRRGSLGWLRTSLGLAAGSLLLVLTRPRENAAIDPVALRRAVQSHFEHAADLILAWWWAHAERSPRPAGQEALGPALPEGICEALAEIYTDVARDVSADTLRETIEMLFQRCEDAGYVWLAVQAGTPFDETMRERFEVIGRVLPGQPVRMRRAALQLNNKVKQKGELRRLEIASGDGQVE